jgi:hypothetical protein
MAPLSAVADRIRSKNAGPARLTVDLFFDDPESYERVRDADVLTETRIARAYGVDESDVLGIYARDRIRAIKVSLRRPVLAGDVRDVDVYGTQQHTPLLDLEVA